MIKKVLKLILLVIVIAIVALLVSGNGHVLTAVSKTYLKGQNGPGIYDLNYFPYDTIKSGETENIWELAEESYPIPQAIEEELTKYQTESILVIKNDTILLEKNFNQHTSDQVSNSFSMAKSLVGLLVAKAITEGYIKGWDTPIQTHWNEAKTSAIGALTFRQLLTMSSALNWQESGKNPFSDNARAYYGSDLSSLLLSKEIIGEPGEVFSYMSGNTTVASIALEKAVNKPLSQYASELWGAIGASQNAFWSKDHQDGVNKSYCCVYATAQDFAKLGQLILNHGKSPNGQTLIDSNLVAEMVSPAQLQLPEGGDCEIYGISFWLAQYKGERVWYARGILGQYIIALPSRNMIVVRLGHKRGPKDDRLHPTDLYNYLDLALSLDKTYEERH